MTKTLVIIESPGKKAKLESILGADYIVRASFGHIRDLPEREIGVKAPDFRPTYVVSDDRAKITVKRLKEDARSVDRVLLATDPDREGEAIAWHIADELKLKNPERSAFTEITHKAVQNAIHAPRPLDMNLVHAQEARRVLDRLVGYQVSPALSDKTGQKLTAGRVQSPAVRLVVEREREIRAFVPTTHFGAALVFHAPTTWRAMWVPELTEGQEYQLDEALAQSAADVKQVRVLAFEDGTSKSAPPAPFTTSTLQQAAQVKFKFKPKKTMELAQKLYEQGVITYMRTDSPNLSEDAFALIAEYAKENGLPVREERRQWKAKGNAQEAHEAIRPAYIANTDGGETEDEKALYRLIWSRAVASQLAEATYATRTAQLESIEAIASGGAARYQARGRTLVDKGWKTLYGEPEDDTTDSDDEDADNPVPTLAVGDVLDVGAGGLITKTTKAPKRYTLATLVKALESHGIGRPATYAAILENISQREYISEDKKGFLLASPVAETIIDNLAGTFGFIELDYTRDLEQDLDEIAEGRKTYRTVVAAAADQLHGEIGKLGPGNVHPCPDCGQPMRHRKGAHGLFWGCTAYPECRATRPDDGGKPGEKVERPAAQAAATQPCPSCGKPMRRIKKSKKDDPKKKGYDFWGCTGFPDCKSTFQPAKDGTPMTTGG